MRVKRWLFKGPDGTTEDFEDEQQAKNAQTFWIEKEVLPTALKDVRASRDRFVRECTVRQRRVKQSGFLTPDLVIEEIHGPDGEMLTTVKGDAHVQIEDLAAKRFPDPTAYNLGPRGGTTVQTVAWAAGLYLDGTYKRLPAFPHWAFGLPIENVLAVLNDLAAQGWSVAHVSEDRGLYAGLTNRTDSAVTTARYLLVRE